MCTFQSKRKFYTEFCLAILDITLREEIKQLSLIIQMRGGLRQRSQSGQNVSFILVERILNTFIKWKKIRISNTIQKLFKRGARTFQSNWLRIPSPCIACFSGDKWELQSLWNSFPISNSIQSCESPAIQETWWSFPLGSEVHSVLAKLKSISWKG